MRAEQTFFSLDMEFNQPSGLAIQVGLAWGSPSKGVQGTRQWLLNPGEPVSEYIIGLTGITQEDINENAVSIPAMCADLSSLLDTHPARILNPVVWGIGDLERLYQTVQPIVGEFHPFGRRSIDVKTLFVFDELARGNHGAGGLAKSMGKFKLPFKGKAHRADIDAQNTLDFFFHLYNRHRAMLSMVEQAQQISR